MCRRRGVLLSASRLAVCDNPQLTMDDQDTGMYKFRFVPSSGSAGPHGVQYIGAAAVGGLARQLFYPFSDVIVTDQTMRNVRFTAVHGILVSTLIACLAIMLQATTISELQDTGVWSFVAWPREKK